MVEYSAASLQTAINSKVDVIDGVLYNPTITSGNVSVNVISANTWLGLPNLSNTDVFSTAMVPVISANSVPEALQILLVPGANSAAVPHTISNAPVYTGNENSITNAFLGDFSNVALSFSVTISGAATLGEPSTLYQYNPSCSGIYGYLSTSSGWNQSTSGNSGRTAATAIRLKIDNFGQGDAMAFNATGFVDGAKPGATSWLANPAVSIIAGDTYAGANGVYLNPVEIDCADQGFDCAAIGWVNNLSRTVSTGALGESWIGYRCQSTGSAAVDAFLSASGPYKFGLDLTSATYSSADAIALQTGQRIDLNATNFTGMPNDTTTSGQYIVYSSGNIVAINGPTIFGLSNTAVFTNASTSIGGSVYPGVDNAYFCGQSSFRWSSVYAVNGTIQTSDPTLKTEIAPLPAALPIVMALEPKTYKWIVGGMDLVQTVETQSVPVTEQKTVISNTVEVRNGVPVMVRKTDIVDTPVYDELPVYDEAGNAVMVTVDGSPERVKNGSVIPATPSRQVQMTHRVQRTEQKQVQTEKLAPRPGARTHWGFLAPDVKAAFANTGSDFGGYVKSEDGTEAIRPDQLLPVLWKAVQELTVEVEELKKELSQKHQ